MPREGRPVGPSDSGSRHQTGADSRVVEPTHREASESSDVAPNECGCEPGCETGISAPSATRTLPIVWQRLITNGETCPRCAGTASEVERAVTQLAEVLRPLEIEPTLETRELDEAAFEAAPDESNRIFVAGRPLEAWIGATQGASECCSVCGTNQCRTVELDGKSFETVPASLIVKAGLAAAVEMLER